MMEDYITQLEGQLQSVVPDDTMAEAGRKILLADFIKMLKHDAGARLGEDPEAVHDMRVATRRMRSSFKLFENFFKSKWIFDYNRRLRKIARALGSVRDLDVMIEGVQQYVTSLELPARTSHKKLSEEEKAAREAAKAELDAQREAMNAGLARLTARRDKARGELVDMLDSKSYRRFVADFGEFLTTTGQGASKDSTYPAGLMLPGIIYDRLAAVRAYDHEVEAHTPETLHALRVEFKRLRYAVSSFTDVLGKESEDFIDELKAIQDHLGRLNDIVVAQATFSDLLEDLDETNAAALQAYIDKLATEQVDLQNSFADVWKRFNTKTVQRKLALAVAGV
jgi:CHAD domain-containing protein